MSLSRLVHLGCLWGNSSFAVVRLPAIASLVLGPPLPLSPGTNHNSYAGRAQWCYSFVSAASKVASAASQDAGPAHKIRAWFDHGQIVYPLSELEMETISEDLLGPDETGVPIWIYISERYDELGPRLKIARRYGNKTSAEDSFFLTISDEPKVIGDPGEIQARDIAVAAEFVRLNKQLLRDYWYQEDYFNFMDMFSKLVKV